MSSEPLTDDVVLARRPSRPRHDPLRHQGLVIEDERTADGSIARVATVFLTGRECPWRCVMCDLWMQAIEEDTPLGAIPAQLDAVLVSLAGGASGDPGPTSIKLYNAGSFFDPRAVPVADYSAIAARLRAFNHVVVESHPALIAERVDLLLDALARDRAESAPVVQLEVAMGLETAHPDALARLNKKMTVAEFVKATGDLRRRGVAVRAFLLVPPPFVPRAEEAIWLARSVAIAFAAGVSVVSLVPTRGGNGALDLLAREGLFRAPRLDDLEHALAAALQAPRGRVFADLWDLDRLADCPECLPARRDRLRVMNLKQTVPATITCVRCGGSPP